MKSDAEILSYLESKRREIGENRDVGSPIAVAAASSLQPLKVAGVTAGRERERMGETRAGGRAGLQGSPARTGRLPYRRRPQEMRKGEKERENGASLLKGEGGCRCPRWKTAGGEGEMVGGGSRSPVVG